MLQFSKIQERLFSTAILEVEKRQVKEKNQQVADYLVVV